MSKDQKGCKLPIDFLFLNSNNQLGVVAPPRKLFPNWTKVSLERHMIGELKFNLANEKHSSKPAYPHLLFYGLSIIVRTR